jgi:murein biosynthesis integral membrane protein MurJ
VAGALSVALIPEFKKLSKIQASRLFLQSSLLAVFVFSMLVIVLIYLSGWVVAIFAPGFTGEEASRAEELLHTVLWLIPVTVLAGVATAYLQSKERFFVPAMGTFIFNGCILSGLILFVSDASDLNIFVWFIVIGGLMRWLSQLWALKNDIFLTEIKGNILLSMPLFSRYYQAVLALGLLSLFPVIVRIFATKHGEGGLAMVNYAIRLVELPMGVVIGVFSIVLFPRLVAYYKERDESKFTHFLTKGLFWAVISAVSIMGVMIINSNGIISLAYGWGAMTKNNLSEISLLLMMSVLSLPLQAITAMLISAFNAQNDTKTPVIIGISGVIFLLLCCWQGGAVYGLKGVVIAFVLAHLFMAISLLLVFRFNKKNDRFDIRLDLMRFFFPAFIAFVVATGGGYLATQLSLNNIVELALGLCSIVISFIVVDRIFPQYRLHHYW